MKRPQAGAAQIAESQFPIGNGGISRTPPHPALPRRGRGGRRPGAADQPRQQKMRRLLRGASSTKPAVPLCGRCPNRPQIHRHCCGKTKRKNSEGSVVSTGRLTWLVVVEPGTATQLVLRPIVSGLDCSCSSQPIWFAGQDRLRLPPLTADVSITGAATAVATLTVPFTAIWLTSHVTV